MKKSFLRKALSLVLATAMVAPSILGTAVIASAADAGWTEENLIAQYSFAEAPEDNITVPNQVTAEGVPGAAVVQNPVDGMWADGALVFDGYDEEAGASITSRPGWGWGTNKGGDPETGVWVKLPDNILTGATSATVSIDVKTSDRKDQNHFLWNIGNNEPGEGAAVNYFFANTKGTSGLKTSGTEVKVPDNNLVALDANVWYNLTTVLDAEANTLTFYVNGEKVRTLTSDIYTLDNFQATDYNTIGRAPWNDELFTGSVSEFSVYDTALTDAQVMALNNENGFGIGGVPLSSAVGDTFSLSTDALFAVPEDARVYWNSSDETIASVDSMGTVTCVSEGTTAVTALLVIDEVMAAKASVNVNVAITNGTQLDAVYATDLAYLTFDNETDGFKGAGAVAASESDVTLGSMIVKDGDRTALNLTNNNAINVAKEDGSSILTGLTDFRVSFDIKQFPGAFSWVFYASYDDFAQGSRDGAEWQKYLGILTYENGWTDVERYLDARNYGRPNGFVGAANAWHHMDVVFQEDSIEIYSDGNKLKDAYNGYVLTSILGENSIIQLGKANWGNGEYANCYIDNFQISVRTDKTALVEAINAGNTVGDPSLYTEESWNAYTEAVFAAMDLAAKTDATQAEVDAAAQALTDAQAALEEAEVPVVLPFEDVAEDAWYYDVVCYNYKEGYMRGKNDTIFAPEDSLTRAEFVSILYAANELPKVDYTPVFEDVAEGEWYEEAVIWARENGIVNGYGNGTFGPNDVVSREQVAVILANYAAYKQYDTDVSAELDAYEDAELVSDYAVPAMKWAVGAGVINGKDGKILDPYGATSRAEIAAVVYNFMNNVQ